MSNTAKNWGDRADKDLFFTIISTKNFGGISGADWAVIGSHMRARYGFTNEGCRQHFQGLRRASLKGETGGFAVNANTSTPDPTANPITRRPGPGRGRPRKRASGASGPIADHAQAPVQAESGVAAATVVSAGFPMPTSSAQPASGAATAAAPHSGRPMHGAHMMIHGLGLTDDAGLDDNGRSVKRARLEPENADAAAESSLDDEAVLHVLAAHASADASYAEFGYGEPPVD